MRGRSELAPVRAPGEGPVTMKMSRSIGSTNLETQRPFHFTTFLHHHEEVRVVLPGLGSGTYQ